MKNSFPHFISAMFAEFAPWLTGLFLIVITATVYSPVRHHEFINFDDGGYVYDNEHVISGLTKDSIRWAFTLIKDDEKGYWHPVTWLSHMLDCRLFGVNPGYHHLSNLFYHLANVFLLFLVLFRMTGAMWRSAAVALLFALHPVNVDSVAWISERKNLLSTTFWMLTMLAYIRYASRPSAWRYLAVIIVFAIGLMAKPMLVTLPCALLLLDFWPLYRFQWFREKWLNKATFLAAGQPTFHEASINRLIIEKLPLLALSFGAIWLSFLSLQKNSQILNKLVQPIGLRVSNALVSYIHYLWQMVWPAKLAIFYPFPTAIPIWQPIVATLALIIITILVVACSKTKPYLATGWFWYVGTLTPVIGIIQGGLWPQIADRWAYVPFIGIFILVAWGVPDVVSRIRTKQLILSGCVALALLVLASLTVGQLTYWKNAYTLFQHTLNVTKNNYFAHMKVGQYFVKKNDHAQAIWHFQKVLEIQPEYSSALEALGEEYVFLKDYDQALNHYRKALLFAPSSVDLYNKIGNLYALMGQHETAVRYYSDAIAIDPEDPAGYNNLGAAYYFTAQLEPAMDKLKKAIELKPDYAEAYYNLGLVEMQSGRAGEAIKHFQKAAELNPDYAEAHNSLGKIFFQNGNLAAAINHFKQAARLSPRDASIHYNIGIILYTQQQIPEAARYFQKALEINPEYEKAKVALQLTIK